MTDVAISALESFAPTNRGTGDARLEYDALYPNITTYSHSTAVREHETWTAEEDSLAEEKAARILATEYLIFTSGKLMQSPSEETQELWAERFTQAASELYGAPSEHIVGQLIENERNFLTGLALDPNIDQEKIGLLMDVYGKYGAKTANAEVGARYTREMITEASHAYGEMLKKRFGYVFKLVEDSSKDGYSPEETRELFADALQLLAVNDDPKWAEWSTNRKDQATGFSVDGKSKQINIPFNRQSTSAQRVKELFAHELLVHAVRSVRDKQSSDNLLQRGLPDHIVTEEGLGVFAGQSVGGGVSETIRDHYLNIAIAMGTVTGQPVGRADLHDTIVSRLIVRAQANGVTVDEKSIQKKAWGQVDRIYKGGPGDIASGEPQAVFTRDIAYYEGYTNIADYITQAYQDGKDMVKLFSYLTQTGFDPTNPKHVAYIEEKGTAYENA